MIEFASGNILGCQAEALVNTVNCVGVMGRGVALEFKKAYPKNFQAYQLACQRGGVQPGHMLVYETGQLTQPRYIINFPTKRHWRGKSRIEDIDAGLEDLVQVIRTRKISSVAIPPLGAGLGGLDWQEVRPRIERALAALPDVQVVIFEPYDASGSPADVTRMSAGRAALVELINHYLEGLLDPCLTAREVHKLMYFIQEAGEPLRLKYNNTSHGPYASNLNPLLQALDGQLLTGAKGSPAPNRPLSLVPSARAQARDCLTEYPDTRSRLERVTRLLDGFESSFGLELLARVHWALRYEGASGLDEFTKRVQASDRGQQFTARQIAIAATRLADQGWFTSQAA